MDVIIVCHTEFGFVSNGEVIYDKNVKSGTSDGVSNLISLAGKYGAKITFAVCPEVAEYMPSKINHEIGLHIHPGWQEFKNEKFSWYVGDYILKEKCKQSVNSTVLKDYSYEEQAGMIRFGREYIIEKLGKDPKIFVAGRWSVNNNTIKALLENNFTHDCSAIPHYQPSHHDWSKLSRICMPYYPSEDDYQKRGILPLLIVPISQMFPRGIVNIENFPLYGLSWFKACFLEYYNQGASLFHICLHSPSMTNDYFISEMNKLLFFISKHENVNFKFVSEIKEYPTKNLNTDIKPYLFAINFNILVTGFKKIFGIK